MDTKEALRRIENIKRNLNSIENAIVHVASDEHKETIPSVDIYRTGTVSIRIKTEWLIEALDRTQREQEAELKKLQAVIDMADLALKGLEE